MAVEADMTDVLRIAVVLLSTLLLGMTSFVAGAPRIAVGEPFPDLPFPSLDDGRPLSVAAYRGQKLVLHIFASW
ncbi:MAG: hypothetical protein FVQ81_03765 [Candidatus Glassbacteria bacterium]|nr:hypothetical protein [Candidatus Glassbacteria bacterium]